MNCTTEEFSWKQEVNAQVNDTRVKNLHMVGEETHNLELEGTASYAVQTTNCYPEVSQLSPGFCDWIRQ